MGLDFRGRRIGSMAGCRSFHLSENGGSHLKNELQRVGNSKKEMLNAPLLLASCKNLLQPAGQPGLFTIFLIELRIEYFRSFSVVPPSEAFASLFSHTVFDYRQKKPLKYSILGCHANFMNNQG